VVADSGELIGVDLTVVERWVLNRGLVEWGGPAHCTDALAMAMGFRDVGDLHAEGGRIADELDAGRPLTRRDWTRALLAAEIVFISDVLGSGVEWPVTTGLDDVATLHALRGIQRKLASVILRRGAWA